MPDQLPPRVDMIEAPLFHVRRWNLDIRHARVCGGCAGSFVGGGLYNAYPPFAKLGADYMQMTRPSGFRKDPALAWGFGGFQLHLYRQTPPHPGFGILREICHAKPDNYFVQTTNVDGHFLKAGFDPHRVYECHGSRVSSDSVWWFNLRCCRWPVL